MFIRKLNLFSLRCYKAGAEQGGYGVFHFTVENSYGDMASYDRENVVQVSNPEMELSYSAETGQFTYTLPDGFIMAISSRR